MSTQRARDEDEAVAPTERTASEQDLSGGDDGTRTHDPLLAKQVLFQLSYVPSGVIIVGRDTVPVVGGGR